MKKTVTILIVIVFTINAFCQVPENWEGKVMTVNGLIPADSMGITLPHEHLLIVHKFNYLDLTDEAKAIDELGYYVNAGGKTLAEASAIGIGRNPEGLKRISTATGVNVLMCTGYYKDNWIHDSLKSKSIAQLAEIIIDDIIYGINGIHAGFIKIAMSNPITPFEEKVLVAAARAQLVTGVAIDVHFDGHRASIGDRHHVLDVFENEGVDLTRVYLSHCVPFVDLVDDYITLAQRGCFLAFDMLGLEIRVDFDGELEIPETINALIDAGYIDQILISQDVCFSVCYVQNGGYGYGHILNNIVPVLKTTGITDEQIHTIMVENPGKVFPIKSYTYDNQCINETFTEASGTVTDNSGTSNYLNNMLCQKLIAVQGASGITLEFTSFATESGYDFVRIYDGATTSATLLGEYSGTSLPPSVSSTGDTMLIVFTTDYSVMAAGWSANYTSFIPTLSVTPGSRSVSAAPGTTTFEVISNTDWSVSESSGWLTATKTNATTLTVSYDENRSVDTRLAELTVRGEGATSQQILVNQSGASPILSVTPESRSISAAPGTTTFAVISNIDWSVSESSGWLEATKTNATTLTVSYDENASVDPRSAEIALSGAGVTTLNIRVNQSGASPILSVTPESGSIDAATGTTTFAVISNIDWSVSESSGWLEATKTNATTLTVSYDENASVDPRSAEIALSGAGVTTLNIRVNQSGASPILSVTPESGSIDAAPGTTTFEVISNIDWSVSESSGWLTATKTNATTLTVSYDENASVDQRSAEIAVSGAGVTTLNIRVNQSGASPILSVTPESRTVNAEPGTTTFEVISNLNWSVIKNASWLTAINTDATTLTVSYDENSSADPRSTEITISGAGVMSQVVLIIQEGAIPSTVKPIVEDQRIRAFPNPVSDKIWITYPEGSAGLIEIYDLSGHMIIRLQDADKNGETEIDFSGYNPGPYIYRLVDNEGNIYFGKILKD